MAQTLALGLADFALGLDLQRLPEDVLVRARHCLLDWLGVTLAGSRESLSRIVREEAADEGGRGEASVLGTSLRLPVAQAALVNGTAGHALDYDDVIEAMLGHPTVGIAPVVLALGERMNADGGAVLAAFVAGVEVSSRLGVIMGAGHYVQGWHATGTIGAFGAAAAAARLLGLDVEQTAHALGIAATQASGLKAMFGTMCKPLHAGHAASVGLRAASLARRGFIARTDAIECAQGFADAHGGRDEAHNDLGAPAKAFHLRDVLFKYHASCYGTHGAIEAARGLRERRSDLSAADLGRITVRVPEGALRMCVIPRPVTGLEGKFSLAYTVGGALAGLDTAALESFADERVSDPAVAAFRDLVEVVGDADLSGFAAEVVLVGLDGTRTGLSADAGLPETDLSRERGRLGAKFRALARPILGEAAAQIPDLLDDFGRGVPLSDVLAALKPQAAAARAN
jgi:2-methylcitrate dehydratase PrpD